MNISITCRRFLQVTKSYLRKGNMLSNVFLSQLVDLLEQLRAIEVLGTAFTFFDGHVDG